MAERTLVFCTAYSAPQHDPYYTWDVRYRIWIEAIRHSALQVDQILLVDDGSDHLPAWSDVRILEEGEDLACDAPAVLFHFRDHVGRRAISDFPGWVRSFFFVSAYARANGFTRIVHVEADAFLITARAQDAVNALKDGWTAFWCNRHQRPESGIQVIAGSGLQTFADWASKPVDDFSGAVIETTLPFTRIERDLVGDRYGEDPELRVPADADWCMQARPADLSEAADYFWWMPWLRGTPAPSEATVISLPQRPAFRFDHAGLYYLETLRDLASQLQPSLYFEIGTHTGQSLASVACDAVCVDPRFLITTDVIGRRRNTHFYQGTSDEFFADRRLAGRLLEDGIDLAFLDGLHLYEALLSDFINTERMSAPQSVILLHDCLPLNARMAERERRFGGEDEPEAIRDFWTGDVWKVVVILKACRPDLTLRYIDCPPTGLVLCGGLDPSDTTLRDAYGDLVAAYRDLSLPAFGLERLWQLCPTIDSRQIAARAVSWMADLRRKVA